MSTTFLNALKNKSASVQALMQQTAKSTPQTIPANHGILLNSKFGTPDQTIVPLDVVPDAPKMTVNIERVLNRNRLDIFFSDIPEKSVRTTLKDKGFRFDGERKAWYHKDTLLNRLFLADTFGADELRTLDTPADVAIPSTDTDVEYSSEYQAFKSQCNALQSELKLDAADLMLKAIECLYNHTFKVN